MSHSEFKCTNCGYIPRDSPVSGKWYCPKCGKRSTIKIEQPRRSRSYLQHKNIHQKSKDEVYHDIYNHLNYKKLMQISRKII